MADRIIQFPARSANQSTIQTATPEFREHLQLLKAAKAAYAALLMAIAEGDSVVGERNIIIKALGEAIRANESEPNPPDTPAPAASEVRAA